MRDLDSRSLNLEAIPTEIHRPISSVELFIRGGPGRRESARIEELDTIVGDVRAGLTQPMRYSLYSSA